MTRKRLSCITLAFGISEAFKTLLKDNATNSPIAFFLLEKQDKPNPKSKKEFVGLNAANNVYKAWGSFLRDPLYQWTKETNAKALQLNVHVSYIHSKFLLMDPLSKDPVVVTGSANFSAPSTNDNDENMLLIRGNRRVADIYFTEFNRISITIISARCRRRRSSATRKRSGRAISRPCSSTRRTAGPRNTSLEA